MQSKPVGHLVLALALVILAVQAGAQNLGLSTASKFASFDLSLAPTVTGSLDSRATAQLNWLDGLQTRAELSALNRQEGQSDSSAESARLDTTAYAYAGSPYATGGASYSQQSASLYHCTGPC